MMLRRDVWTLCKEKIVQAPPGLQYTHSVVRIGDDQHVVTHGEDVCALAGACAAAGQPVRGLPLRTGRLAWFDVFAVSPHTLFPSVYWQIPW